MATQTAPAAGEEPSGRRRLRLRCWGDFALIDSASGADLRPRGRKARALLAYLALHPGKAVSRERLCGLLWGDRGEEQARASLRQAIVELKPLTNGTVRLLAIDRDSVTLDPAGLSTDLNELREAAEASRHARLLTMLPDPEERLFANLDGLDSAFDDWLAVERTRQTGALAGLIQEAAGRAARQGAPGEARALEARLYELEPTVAQPARNGAATAPALTSQPPRSQLLGPAQRSTARRLWLPALLAALAVMAGLIGYGLWRSSPKAAPPGSIAVLPFRNVPGSDAAFGEGLAEEISAQLARQPGLRVAGRTSARQFGGGSADLGEVGRRLGVRYVVEGSVRSAGQQVRINVALARASDGLQLWADSFDGRMDDIFAIQARIGARVAATMQQRLGGQGTPTAAPARSGAVHTAYLTARALIRERNLRAMLLAKEQLDRALALDPGFAPAWASMAQVKFWGNTLPGRTREQAHAEALADARRALTLEPDLAEAHGVLGIILGYGHPQGKLHVRRAAELDPDNPEFLFWLGMVHVSDADFPKMLDAHRRAFAADPLWSVAHDSAARSLWGMGYRKEAQDFVERVEREGSRYDGHMARGYLASHAGDLSRAVAEFGAARAATRDVGKQARAAWERMGLFFNLGFLAEARHEYVTCHVAWFKEQKRPLDMPTSHTAHLALARGELPSPAKLAPIISATDWFGGVLARDTVKRLISAGRAADAVAVYETEAGLLGLSSRRPPTASAMSMVQNAPVVAAALTAVGRRPEAERLLRHADGLIAAALRRSGGAAPADFYADTARTWALLGKRGPALAALERAAGNGWLNAQFVAGDLVDDVGDDPTFAALRGHPRFERLRAGLSAQLERERRELARKAA